MLTHLGSPEHIPNVDYCFLSLPQIPQNDKIQVIAGILSGDDVVNYFAGDVGQAEVAAVVAVGQPFMIQAEQMQNEQKGDNSFLFSFFFGWIAFPRCCATWVGHTAESRQRRLH